MGKRAGRRRAVYPVWAFLRTGEAYRIHVSSPVPREIHLPPGDTPRHRCSLYQTTVPWSMDVPPDMATAFERDHSWRPLAVQGVRRYVVYLEGQPCLS